MADGHFGEPIPKFPEEPEKRLRFFALHGRSGQTAFICALLCASVHLCQRALALSRTVRT